MACCCLRSRNFKNEAALVRVGLLRQSVGSLIFDVTFCSKKCLQVLVSDKEESLSNTHHGEFLYVCLTVYFAPETEKRSLKKRDVGSLQQTCERILTLFRTYEI